jgi:hypothetical protein
MRCPNCGHEVPRAEFCVRCGEPLENRASPYPLETRGYAAAPDERWGVPRVVSSLFPHLPRSDMHTYRVALLVGSAVVVGLSVFKLFPLALVMAAALVPLLTILYLWDVDLYEDEPLPMLAFTTVWGAAAGVGLGFATRAVTRAQSSLGGTVGGHELLWLGVVLPLAAVVLMLAGPLVLLPYRRFNDVLDGVTFGSACAVSLLGAEAITNSAPFLGEGLTAAGSVSLWVARLLTLGIAFPVLGAGMVGAAAGSLWLRYRAPVRDRGALGVPASSAVAIALATAAIVGASVVELYIGPWWSLTVISVLATVALIALRRVIHLGLREEAAEVEIGPPARCANCGRETPTHTFCAHCGVALRALPKAGRSATERRSSSRLARPVALAAFGVAAAAAVGVAAAVILVTRPGAVRPPCERGRPCGAPPQAPGTPRPQPRATGGGYVTGARWTSSIGPSLRYNPRWWRVLQRGARTLELQLAASPTVLVRVVTVPTAATTPIILLDHELRAAGGRYLGLAADGSQSHLLLEPMVGYVHGIGGAYRATSNIPPSPSKRVELMFQVATRGPATALVRAVTDDAPHRARAGVATPFPAFWYADALLETFEWRGP